VRPLFLFSLPRSGSTLTQRVLVSHPEIATTSETWMLLPHLYASRPHGLRADYWQESASEAIREFSAGLPGGRNAYRRELATFARRVYELAAGPEATYFLEKTPHYHAIAEDVMELFDDARFVFLWRNPMSVVSSCLETFRESRWEPDLFSFDLHDGVANLTAAWGAADDRAHAVRYEDLVGPDGVTHWEALFAHLELPFDPGLLSRFQETRLVGTYGDPTGVNAYAELTAEPLEKWKRLAAGRTRKAWSRRYLRWIGADRMATMGYDLDDLLTQLDALPDGGTGARDLVHCVGAMGRERLRRAALAHPDSPRPRGPAFR